MFFIRKKKKNPSEKPSAGRSDQLAGSLMFLILHGKEMICFRKMQDLFITTTS